MRCTAKTLKGVQCKKSAIKNSAVCSSHTKASAKSKVAPKSKKSVSKYIVSNAQGLDAIIEALQKKPKPVPKINPSIIDKLPEDMIIEIMLGVEPNDLKNFCRSNTRISQICGSDKFRNLYGKRWPEHPLFLSKTALVTKDVSIMDQIIKSAKRKLYLGTRQAIQLSIRDGNMHVFVVKNKNKVKNISVICIKNEETLMIDHDEIIFIDIGRVSKNEKNKGLRINGSYVNSFMKESDMRSDKILKTFKMEWLKNVQPDKLYAQILKYIIRNLKEACHQSLDVCAIYIKTLESYLPKK